MKLIISSIIASLFLVMGCRSSPTNADHVNHVRWLSSIDGAKTQDNGSGACQVILSKWHMMEYLDLDSEEQCLQRSKYVIQDPFLVSYQSVVDLLAQSPEVTAMRNKISNGQVSVDIMDASTLKNTLFDRLMKKSDGKFSLAEDMNDIVQFRMQSSDAVSLLNDLKLRKSELKGAYEGEDVDGSKYFFGSIPSTFNIDGESEVGYEVKVSQ